MEWCDHLKVMRRKRKIKTINQKAETAASKLFGFAGKDYLKTRLVELRSKLNL